MRVYGETDWRFSNQMSEDQAVLRTRLGYQRPASAELALEPGR